MEIKGVKFSHNKEFADCLRGVIPSLLSIILEESQEAAQGGANRLVALMTTAKRFLAKGGWGYVIVKPLVQQQSIDGLALIAAIEETAVAEGSPYYAVFRMVLQVLHEAELLADDAFDKWIEDRTQDESQSNVKKLFNEPQVQAFVEWLNEDEEDEDDDEEDDEED